MVSSATLHVKVYITLLSSYCLIRYHSESKCLVFGKVIPVLSKSYNDQNENIQFNCPYILHPSLKNQIN